MAARKRRIQNGAFKTELASTRASDSLASDPPFAHGRRGNNMQHLLTQGMRGERVCFQDDFVIASVHVQNQFGISGLEELEGDEEWREVADRPLTGLAG